MKQVTALGLTLLVLGAIVAVAEAHFPAHGIAGGLGVLAMAIGAVLAISGLGGGLLVALLAGGALAGSGAALLSLTVKRGLGVRTRRVKGGAEGLIGHVGVVRTWTGQAGNVAMDGALWHARESLSSDEEAAELHAGDPVVVERLNGLTLCVRRAEEWELL
jgi:membrane-bound ClpP family serine protease